MYSTQTTLEPNAATSFNRTQSLSKSVSFEIPHIVIVCLKSQDKDTSSYRTVYCGPNGVLIIEVPLYRTVYCGPSGVLIIEVPLYRTVYCGPNGVLTIEVLL